MRIRPDKVVSTLKWVFLLIGLGLMAAAALLYLHTEEFVERAQRTEGTVTDLVRSRSGSSSTSSGSSSTYKPVVQFTTNEGKHIEFTETVGSNPPSHRPGDTVTVLYDPADPYDAAIDHWVTLWFFPILTGALGIPFFLVGAGFGLYGFFSVRRRETLMRRGMRVDAKFQRVEQATNVRMGGRHPFRVVAHWQDPSSGELHVFRSENLWFDPSDYIRGDTVPVLIERGNPKRHYMDLSFLPKLAD